MLKGKHTMIFAGGIGAAAVAVIIAVYVPSARTASVADPELAALFEVCEARDAARVAGAANAPHALEHAAFTRLAPRREATHVAVASGDWSAPETWHRRAIPGKDARILIPEWTAVRLDGRLEHHLDRVRVEGQLHFATDRDTKLSARTVVVHDYGKLTIGTPDQPVLPQSTARLHFVPRSAGEIASDATDLGGGLIASGTVVMHGARKTPFIKAARTLERGMSSIELEMPAEGWSVGDRLVVPGVHLLLMQDEVVLVKAVSSDRRRVQLNRPLKHDHAAPQGVGIPVGNLSRNVRVASVLPTPLSARGHVMIMHRQSGTAIDGIALEGLGRTDTRVVHTIPDGGRRADDNTIGRYALHFHVRSGADRETPPHVVRNSVIVDSPKHGLVNHGGHVVAEGNIGFRVNGSHFFAENGSEIGAFRGNLAVRSLGSGDTLRAREFIGDHGHGGHGFWSQSAAVEMSGNWSFGHTGAAYVVFGYPVREGGAFARFEARNLPPGERPAAPSVDISEVDLRLHGNVAAASDSGLEIWVHKIFAENGRPSFIEDLTVWNVRSQAVFVPYAQNLVLRNIRLMNDLELAGANGIAVNDMSGNLRIEHLDARGFVTGVQIPPRGRNLLRNACLDNVVDVSVPSPTAPNRVVELENVNFGERARRASSAVLFEPLRPPVNADVALLFEPDRVYLQHEGRREQLYGPGQRPDAVFAFGPQGIRGMTNQALKERHGLEVGGGLAPNESVKLAGSNAMIGAPYPDPGAYRRGFTSAEGDYAKSLDAQYPKAHVHFKRGIPGAEEGWRLEPGESASQGMRFVDTTPPTFVLTPALLPLEIHPEDIRHGFRVEGMLYDLVGTEIAMRAFTQDFLDLKARPDGYVHLRFEVHDLAGNTTPVHLPLRVSGQAVRRGRNLSYFSQRKFCGDCATDMAWIEQTKRDFARKHRVGL